MKAFALSIFDKAPSFIFIVSVHSIHWCIYLNILRFNRSLFTDVFVILFTSPASLLPCLASCVQTTVPPRKTSFVAVSRPLASLNVLMLQITSISGLTQLSMCVLMYKCMYVNVLYCWDIALWMLEDSAPNAANGSVVSTALIVYCFLHL